MKTLRTVSATLVACGIIWLGSMDAAGQSPDKPQIKIKPIDPSQKSQEVKIPEIDTKIDTKNARKPEAGEIWLYAALTDGTLERRVFKAIDPNNDAVEADYRGPYFEGSPGWNEFKHLFSLNGKLYGIYEDGKVVWYSGQGHGQVDGYNFWTGHKENTDKNKNPIVVPFPIVFPMGNYEQFTQSLGVMYAIDKNGNVWWYRPPAEPNSPWEDPRQVKTGWTNQRLVFAGGDGVIYSIDDKGDLWWQKHHNWWDYSQVWEEPKMVWRNFEQIAKNSNGRLTDGRQTEENSCKTHQGVNEQVSIFGAGNGVIYAADPCGHVTVFRHADWKTGGTKWDIHTWFTSVSNLQRLFAYIPPPPPKPPPPK